jgi:hypothetical protein
MCDNIFTKAPFILTSVLANAVGVTIWFKIEEKKDETAKPWTRT